MVITDSAGSQRLVRAKSEASTSDNTYDDKKRRKRTNKSSTINTRAQKVVQITETPSRELSLVAFQDNLAISYFYSSYKWGGLWKPFIESLHDFDTAGKSGVLALIYGHIGMANGLINVRVRGQQLYGQCISQVQSQLDQCDQLENSQVARIAMPVMLMAMYSVS